MLCGSSPLCALLSRPWSCRSSSPWPLAVCVPVLTMGPDVVTSRVMRLCLEVTPNATTGNHLPFLLLFHLVMVMRNLASPHSEGDTSALSAYLSAKAQGMKKIDQAAHWLADAMGVSTTALDVRARITVRNLWGLLNVMGQHCHKVGLCFMLRLCVCDARW